MTVELTKVADFVLGKHPELTELGGDVDLIESRLIDSLSFVEFVFLIEQLSGKSIPIDTIDIADVRTLNRIGERYFGGARA
ncbi:MAG: acyl carrier protein [Actinomycetota bacterium]|nr:acyl carrier protein [Actinomycetota bacterium]